MGNKQLYGRFKRPINNISHQKTWTWPRKENFKKETESLLIAAQDIRTNHIIGKIDKTQQNSKCRLCGDRDETINHIISECSKLAQKKYKARHDCVGKMIHWEMCRKFQVDHTNKWYMHNPAPVLENDSHKLLWDFSIQTYHLIPARTPDLIILNKKKKRICKIVDFAVPVDHRINLKESEKKDKYLDLARELKKLWNMKVMIVQIVIGALGIITKGLLKSLEDLEFTGRVETIQTTALLRTDRILWWILETWGDLQLLKLQWKTISWHRCEKLWRSIIIIIIIIEKVAKPKKKHILVYQRENSERLWIKEKWWKNFNKTWFDLQNNYYTAKEKMRYCKRLHATVSKHAPEAKWIIFN